MKILIACCAVSLALVAGPSVLAAEPKPDADGWITLFDGKTYDNWKIAENKESWAIEDGCLVAKGPRSHIFYTAGEFENFEFQADVLTTPGSNGGIFFATKFQEESWPTTGYETQVNVSHRDPVKTGSLYNNVKVFETAAKDDEFWTQAVIVKGKQVTIKVNDRVLFEYVEPENRSGTMKLGKGTFALQAHDPNSVVKYKNLKARRLP